MFISNAFAQTAGAASADTTGGFLQMLPLVAVFVVMYFVMIRPQMKRQKEHKTMVEALAKGDEVITGGGMLGKVVNFFGGKSAREGVVSTVAVAGDRKMTTSGDNTGTGNA